MSEGKPPIDPRFQKARKKQQKKQIVYEKTALRMFMFQATLETGMVMMFNIFGDTVERACETAWRYCEAKGMKMRGRVAQRRSAYDRALAEGL